MKENIPDAGKSSLVYQDTDISLINFSKFTFANDSKLHDVKPHEEIVRILQLIARPPIIVLGTIGNLLSWDDRIG